MTFSLHLGTSNKNFETKRIFRGKIYSKGITISKKTLRSNLNKGYLTKVKYKLLVTGRLLKFVLLRWNIIYWLVLIDDQFHMLN